MNKRLQTYVCLNRWGISLIFTIFSTPQSQLSQRHHHVRGDRCAREAADQSAVGGFGRAAGHRGYKQVDRRPSRAQASFTMCARATF